MSETPREFIEQRQDYPQLLFMLESLRIENGELKRKLDNAALEDEKMQKKIEKLEKDCEYFHSVAKQFEQLKNDIRWIKWISQGIGAILFFFFGDVIKKRLGL